jgi:uncharacterized SAM-binding protein YcdF (DUF218 family)
MRGDRFLVSASGRQGFRSGGISLPRFKRFFSARILRRLLLVCVAVPIFLLVLETGYFVWALAGGGALQEADLVVAFEGGYGRIRAAYSLVDHSYAANLLISPATEHTLKVYEKRFLPSRSYDRVMEDKSRTTLENAVHTGEVIRENRFQSAILVTSWDHMPRSYFFLRTITCGSGIRIQRHPVGTGSLSQTNRYRHRLGWKMVYNEMVQFWGSLIELAQFRISGELPDQALGKSGLAGRLKQILLFDLNGKSLHE